VSRSSNVPLIVVGCFHQAQFLSVRSGYEESQRAFTDLIESLVKQHDVRFIGEEATFVDGYAEQATTAKAVADRLQLRYLNIDIPLMCKETIRHRPPNQFNEETLQFEDLLAIDKYAKAWNLVREYHMYQIALEQLQTFPEPSLLVVGILHVEPISSLLPPWIDVTKIIFEQQ
jgi:hypothetical protein